MALESFNCNCWRLGFPVCCVFPPCVVSPLRCLGWRGSVCVGRVDPARRSSFYTVFHGVTLSTGL